MSSYRHTSLFSLFFLPFFPFSFKLTDVWDSSFSVEPKFWTPDPSGYCSSSCVFCFRASCAAGGWRKHQGGPG